MKMGDIFLYSFLCLPSFPQRACIHLFNTQDKQSVVSARTAITKYHRLGAQAAEMYFLTVPEAGSPR